MLFLLDLLEVGLLGLVDLGEQYHHESNDEYAAGNEERRSGIAHGSLSGIGNKSAHDYIDCNSCRTVEHAADLYQLVASVTAATEDVKHRVDNRIEHTHAKAADEGADKINGKSCATHAFPAAHPLHEDTDYADYQGYEGRALIAHFFQKHTGGNTHQQVSDKVAVVTDLCLEIAGTKLIFHNDSHRRTQIGHEGNHSKQGYHHDDGTPLFFLVAHN